MRFGKCLDCFSYKYLEDGKCLNCKPDDEWVVIQSSPPAGPAIYRSGLTESRAKEIADREEYLVATPLSEYRNI